MVRVSQTTRTSRKAEGWHQLIGVPITERRGVCILAWSAERVVLLNSVQIFDGTQKVMALLVCPQSVSAGTALLVADDVTRAFEPSFHWDEAGWEPDDGQWWGKGRVPVVSHHITHPQGPPVVRFGYVRGRVTAEDAHVVAGALAGLVSLGRFGKCEELDDESDRRVVIRCPEQTGGKATLVALCAGDTLIATAELELDALDLEQAEAVSLAVASALDVMIHSDAAPGAFAAPGPNAAPGWMTAHLKGPSGRVHGQVHVSAAQATAADVSRLKGALVAAMAVRCLQTDSRR